MASLGLPLLCTAIIAIVLHTGLEKGPETQWPQAPGPGDVALAHRKQPEATSVTAGLECLLKGGGVTYRDFLPLPHTESHSLTPAPTAANCPLDRISGL